MEITLWARSYLKYAAGKQLLHTHHVLWARPNKSMKPPVKSCLQGSPQQSACVYIYTVSQKSMWRYLF